MKQEQALEIISKHKSRFDYGETIHEAEFRTMFGVYVTSDSDFEVMAASMSKKQIKQQLEQETLLELSAAGVVKDILHSQGKHLFKSGDVYRIALPSENETIASRYRSKASRAIAKAKKLTMNTPHLSDGQKTTSKSLNALMS